VARISQIQRIGLRYFKIVGQTLGKRRESVKQESQVFDKILFEGRFLLFSSSCESRERRTRLSMILGIEGLTSFCAWLFGVRLATCFQVIGGVQAVSILSLNLDRMRLDNKDWRLWRGLSCRSLCESPGFPV
jgi:hypothetical protein